MEDARPLASLGQSAKSSRSNQTNCPAIATRPTQTVHHRAAWQLWMNAAEGTRTVRSRPGGLPRGIDEESILRKLQPPLISPHGSPTCASCSVGGDGSAAIGSTAIAGDLASDSAGAAAGIATATAPAADAVRPKLAIHTSRSAWSIMPLPLPSAPENGATTLPSVFRHTVLSAASTTPFWL